MNEEIQIIFMRHGRSRADDEGVHEGRYDSPLTDVGKEQAGIRAQDFIARGLHFDLIIASNLVRAAETARIIARSLQAPLELDSDWMELDNGPLAGLPFKEAQTRYPTPAFRNPYEVIHGSGESRLDISLRAAQAVQSVVRRGPGCYLVVAHGGVLNAALRGIAGLLPAANTQGIRFSFGDTGYLHSLYLPGKHEWHILEFVPGFHTS